MILLYSCVVKNTMIVLYSWHSKILWFHCTFVWSKILWFYCTVVCSKILWLYCTVVCSKILWLYCTVNIKKYSDCIGQFKKRRLQILSVSKVTTHAGSKTQELNQEQQLGRLLWQPWENNIKFLLLPFLLAL